VPTRAFRYSLMILDLMPNRAVKSKITTVGQRR
jgi:hypothetical protein